MAPETGGAKAGREVCCGEVDAPKEAHSGAGSEGSAQMRPCDAEELPGEAASRANGGGPTRNDPTAGSTAPEHEALCNGRDTLACVRSGANNEAPTRDQYFEGDELPVLTHCTTGGSSPGRAKPGATSAGAVRATPWGDSGGPVRAAKMAGNASPARADALGARDGPGLQSPSAEVDDPDRHGPGVGGCGPARVWDRSEDGNPACMLSDAGATAPSLTRECNSNGILKCARPDVVAMAPNRQVPTADSDTPGRADCRGGGEGAELGRSSTEVDASS